MAKIGIKDWKDRLELNLNFFLHIKINLINLTQDIFWKESDLETRIRKKMDRRRRVKGLNES